MCVAIITILIVTIPVSTGCDKTVCYNGGNCTKHDDTAVDNETCVCAFGYTGFFCETGFISFK